MKDQIMTRFVALTCEPDNPAGIATYTFCGRSLELPMPSYTRAREVENFIGHVVGNARRQQREAFAAQMRGAINNVEGSA